MQEKENGKEVEEEEERTDEATETTGLSSLAVMTRT